jgi:hypothetical protein
MAQQIKIDIVADTQKLVSGINETNGQIDGMSSKFKGVAAAAGLAASAFVAKAGVSFLKQGYAEAQDAALAMNSATAAFGAGSEALKKITDDADKFGKSLGMDNDDIIKLSTQLGTYLPESARGLSAELINVGADVAALTGVDIEAWTKKLAKGMADGELKAGDLEKMFPKLSKATYDQAEAAFKAGDANKALSILIADAESIYGDAAEKNVTATQKFDVALANLKETVGAKILPIVNQFISALTRLLDWFSKQPSALQNIELGLLAIVAVGGPFLGFLASAKTSLAVLGITQGEVTLATIASKIATVASTVATGAATAAQWLLNTAMLAFPGVWITAAIVAVIAIIVLLVKNWDTVTKVVGEVWDAIKNFASDAWSTIKSLGSKIGDFVSGLIGDFKSIPASMLSVGRDIVTGIWNGINSVAGWLQSKITNFFGNLVPSWAKKVLGIGSPSKVFAAYGRYIVEGLAVGINRNAELAKKATQGLGLGTIGAFGNLPTPTLATAGTGTVGNKINVTINAGIGTDPYALGRTVQEALSKYGKITL